MSKFQEEQIWDIMSHLKGNEILMKEYETISSDKKITDMFKYSLYFEKIEYCYKLAIKRLKDKNESI